jgi:DNA mismatch repair protein MutS2
MGVPGESSALEIAAGLGFPPDVIARARSYMNQDWLNLAERLKQLTAERDAAARVRAELERERELARVERQDLEERSRRSRALEKTERQRARLEQESLLRDTRREIENLVRRIREEQAGRESIKAAKDFVERRLATEPAPAPEPTPRPNPGLSPAAAGLNPGDHVRSGTFGREGAVIELIGAEAVVAFGNIRMRLPTRDLERISATRPVHEPEPVDVDETFDPRLNLRGMTQDEARESVERFLDRAVAAGGRNLSILHGKGTGALRTMLWDLLGRDRRVSEIRHGEPNEGGSGVTFVTMRE